MKKRNIIAINNMMVDYLPKQSVNSGNAKFKFFISKMKRAIEEEMKSFSEIEPKNDSVYISDMQTLGDEYKKLIESTDDKIQISVFEVEYASKVKDIQETHKDAIDKYKKEMAEFVELLEDPSDLHIPTINIKDVPDFLAQPYVDLLLELITED